MASKWARDRAEKIIDGWEQAEDESLRDGHRSTFVDFIAAALDGARREGEERERCECHNLTNKIGSGMREYAHFVQVGGDIAKTIMQREIAARGPMRGLEDRSGRG